MLPSIFSEFSDLFHFLLHQDTPVFLVGGAVRDLILGRSSHDLDFVALGDASSLARKTANHFNGAFYWLDTKRDTARVLLELTHSKKHILDFARVREGSLNADLMDRDFTINAIALNLETMKLIDPLNGAGDLKKQLLRACSTESFKNDPVRLLRAVRFALYNELKVEPETRAWMKTAVPSLPGVSGERLRDEFFRLLENGKASTAARLLQQTGSLPYILVELTEALKHNVPQDIHGQVWELVFKLLQHTDGLYNLIDSKVKQTHENIRAAVFIQQMNPQRTLLQNRLNSRINPGRSVRGLDLYTAIFLALTISTDGSDQELLDVEMTSRLFQECSKRLALSNSEIKHGLTILENFRTSLSLIQQSEPPERKQIYRFFNRAGEAGVDLCLIALAVIITQKNLQLKPEIWEIVLKNCSVLLTAWSNHRSEYIFPPQLITGNDLIQHFRVIEGPGIGRVLEQVREAQAVGQITNQEEALELAKSLIDKGSGVDTS